MGRVHRGIWMDKRKSRRIEGLMSGWVVIGRRDGLAGKGKHADGYSSTADDCDGDGYEQSSSSSINHHTNLSAQHACIKYAHLPHRSHDPSANCYSVKIEYE